MRRWIFNLAAVIVLASASANHAGEREKIVKGSATASKIDADGKQTVTITLEIKKGFFIYANPVGSEYFEDDRTVISVKAKGKVETRVLYPPGKAEEFGKIKVYTYENSVTIQASAQRAAGDQSPLEITVDCRPRSLAVCVLPERITLTAK